jgi:aminopeptidase N
VHQALAAEYATTAAKEYTYFTTLYNPFPAPTVRIVELPDDTVPSAWAPQLAAIASRAVSEKINYRLLANTIAHQWWGASVSPASRDDWWLEDGFARYSEARYVESAAGEAGLEEAVKDMSVGALAYDTVPLSSAGKLDMFSPEFQSLTTDKGAMILHMLRWVEGEAKFNQTMRTFATQFMGKFASLDDFRAIAEKDYGDKLTWFFSQWLDSTGAPEFKTKYTVYRLGENNKGFRIVGEIAQDLDLFRMPVELKIDTDGKTEDKRVEVVGTNSPFTVETFGKPRRIVIDPDDHVLKNSKDVKLRSSILRGQAMVQQGDLAGALAEFKKALDVNQNSSLAHYRIAEVFFQQRNYQAAANAYRESLNGDGEPRWTEVWSHIQLGKIFDITGQRERATNEYRQALQTNDNTQGALDEARRYLQKAYEQQKNGL